MHGMTRDLYSGPLKEPEFLEATPQDFSVSAKSRGKKWVLSATLAATSLLLVIPQASASRQDFPLVASQGADAVPEIANWRRWIAGLHNADLDPEVVRRLREAFTQVIEPTGLVPGGMATPSGAYLLTWELEQHHLELELFTNHWEWFYKNRKTGRLAGEENIIGTDFSRFRKELVKHGF